MKTHRDIISLWPRLADFASDIGVPENTAKQMRTRNSINARYWPALVRAAQSRGIDGVTFEDLNACIIREAAE